MKFALGFLLLAFAFVSHWLEQEYKLNTGEIAVVLGSSMRYDIVWWSIRRCTCWKKLS